MFRAFAKSVGANISFFYMIFSGGSCLAIRTMSLGLQSWLGSSATLPQPMQTKLMFVSLG